MSVITRPDREPDITFPNEDYARPVSLWEKEGIFVFEDGSGDENENNIHPKITFGGDTKYTPREFIEFIANCTKYPKRRTMAQEYLMTLQLEQAVFGEEVT